MDHVRESADADDGDRGDERLRAIAEGIRCRVRELGSPCLMDPRWMNGELLLHRGGFSNHRDEAVPGFFEEAGERAPGSYGLLHVRDDEDPGHENETVVHRLLRGVAAAPVERCLSLCVLVPEDPFGEWGRRSVGPGTVPRGPAGRRPARVHAVDPVRASGVLAGPGAGSRRCTSRKE